MSASGFAPASLVDVDLQQCFSAATALSTAASSPRRTRCDAAGDLAGGLCAGSFLRVTCAARSNSFCCCCCFRFIFFIFEVHSVLAALLAFKCSAFFLRFRSHDAVELSFLTREENGSKLGPAGPGFDPFFRGRNFSLSSFAPSSRLRSQTKSALLFF